MASNQDKLVILSGLSRGKLPDVRHLVECGVKATEFSRRTSTYWKARDTLLLRPFPMSKLDIAPALVLKTFHVWICGFRALDRLGRPMYVELDVRFPSGSGRADCIVWFLRQLSYRDTTITAGIGLLATHPLQQVFIPAEWAHPGGYFFTNLPSYPYLLKALIVAFVGVINPVMCRGCIRSYLSTTTRFDEHILTPFHACISVPGYMNGACANCIWHNRSDCDWRCLPGYMASGRQEGPRKFPLGGKATNPNMSTSYALDVFNPRSCPRIIGEYPSEAGGSSDLEICRRAALVSAQVLRNGYRAL